jgi:curved DNA-binding protein CbpA
MGSDPYATLGVSASATDAEVRAAYRRLVQLHHPDHNGGSPASARRFEDVQEAYAAVRVLRTSARPGRTSSTRPPTRPAPGGDDALGSRLAAMEAELRAAREQAARVAREAAARQRAARAAREAARASSPEGEHGRATDEELGYITTDDSFGKILSDAATELGGRLDHVAEEARRSDLGKRVGDTPAAKRFADLIDELGSRLTGEGPDRKE